MKSLLGVFAFVGGVVAATEAVVGPLDTSQYNMILNVVMIALVSAMGWGLKQFASRLLTKVDEMNHELTRVCTTVENRSGQQQQIDHQQLQIADMRVSIAKLESQSK